MKIIFITHFVPSPVGNGGNHRTYQIVRDLCDVVSEEQVCVLSLPQWRQSRADVKPAMFVQRILSGLKRRFRYYMENPLRVWFKTGYFSAGWTPPDFLHYYEHKIAQTGRPAAVVLEHTGFADILRFNLKQGIPTLACIQNLESLDYGESISELSCKTLARMGDLTVETNVLARCNGRLFISKVEAGLIGGMGFQSYYYPYLPVGRIRESLLKIRQQRNESAQERGLFLMIGSAIHGTTGEAFAWFIQQAQRHSLPSGMRVVVAGAGTEKLLTSGSTIPRLECRGWLTQEVLDQLLVKAQGMLVPQFRGFGALTRLPEMACIGIPTLVSCHPTFALDVPPNVCVVKNTWLDWRKAMLNVMHTDKRGNMCDYADWESRQPRALRSWIERLLLVNTERSKNK